MVNTELQYIVGILDIFMPMLFMFTALSALLVYIFIFFRYRKIGYLYIFMFSLLFISNNLFHIFALLFGVMRHNIPLALSLSRVSLVCLMFMFIFLSLYGLNGFYQVRKKRKYMYRAYFILFITTSAVLLPIIAFSFIKPNLFIPMDNNNSILMTDIIYQYSKTYIQAPLLYDVFKKFVLFFVLANVVLIMIKISTDENISKFNVITLTFWLISLFFAYEFSRSNIILFKKHNFDRMSISMFMFIAPYMLTLLDTFLDNSLKFIKEQEALSSIVMANEKKIEHAKRNPVRINKLSKHIQSSSYMVSDVLRENENAISIIYKKLKDMSLYKDLNLDDLEKNLNTSAKSLENVFDTFKNTREQIDERRKFLFNLMIDNNKIANTDTKIQDVIKNLKSSSNSLAVESNMVFKKIYLAVSNFYDLEEITKTISETIHSIKEITNKTNLLSINSSIQASKAGNFGRSFSIITKEIGFVASESMKITEQIEKVLKDVFNSLIAIDSVNQSIKIECKSFESYVSVIKDNISKLINMLEEYSNTSTEGKKILRDINTQNLHIESITKQQNSLALSLEKNILSLIELENNMGKIINEHKTGILDITDNLSDILKIEEDMKNDSRDIAIKTNEMSERCDEVYDTLENYKDIEV